MPLKGRRAFLLLVGASSFGGCFNDGTVALNGAGATFPYPLYSKWIEEYRSVNPAVRINYQSIGSGGGVRQVVAGTVDFGASDVPAEPGEERGAVGGLVHVPTAIGCVVVSYNLPGLTAPLKLTPDVLAAIFLGEIARWNAPALAAMNPELTLPDLPIAVIYRTDGSGTTAIFSRYLATASKRWEGRIGAKGNEGVTGQLQATPGAIGYTELAYATQNNLPRAAIKNRAGRFVIPSSAAATAAAEAIAMPPTLQVSLESANAEAAYPLATYTYLLLYADAPDARRGAALAHFLWWAVHEGQHFAAALDYAPLPHSVVATVEKTLKTLRAAGKPALVP